MLLCFTRFNYLSQIFCSLFFLFLWSYFCVQKVTNLLLVVASCERESEGIWCLFRWDQMVIWPLNIFPILKQNFNACLPVYIMVCKFGFSVILYRWPMSCNVNNNSSDKSCLTWWCIWWLERWIRCSHFSFGLYPLSKQNINGCLPILYGMQVWFFYYI